MSLSSKEVNRFKERLKTNIATMAKKIDELNQNKFQSRRQKQSIQNSILKRINFVDAGLQQLKAQNARCKVNIREKMVEKVFKHLEKDVSNRDMIAAWQKAICQRPNYRFVMNLQHALAIKVQAMKDGQIPQQCTCRKSFNHLEKFRDHIRKNHREAYVKIYDHVEAPNNPLERIKDPETISEPELEPVEDKIEDKKKEVVLPSINLPEVQLDQSLIDLPEVQLDRSLIDLPEVQLDPF